ncbi:MAG: glycosyltransferase family 9 protein [Xanthobacteraceae bacterium]|nr:glycosyltransferase family 9 protein [Xanthobacteraceae bacterium]
MRRLYAWLAEHVFPGLPRGLRARALLMFDRLVLNMMPAPRSRRGVMVLFVHGLGDMVLFTEALKLIRACHPGEPLLLVCGKGTEDYARSYLRPDRIIALDRERLARAFLYRIVAIMRVARQQAAVAIQPSFNRFHLVEDALVHASGADLRIGSTGSDLFISDRERSSGDGWYTRLIPQPPRTMHDLERTALFVAALTGRDVSPLAPRLPLPPRSPSGPAGGYFVVALDASTPLRTWPTENFIAALQAVAAKSALAPVVVGSDPARLLPRNPNIVDLTGKTDLEALIRVIANADLVIANDSAPTHLAIALGVPVVAVCGGGLPVRYLPYPDGAQIRGRLRVITVDDAPWTCFGCGWRCIHIGKPDRAAPCIADIRIARVVDEALDLLALAPRAAAPPRA